MSELFLVRHAQASFGRDDYDRLSDVGHRQSRWLGEYFAARDIRFDQIMTGAMLRHRETAAGTVSGMGIDIAAIDECPEWNEYDFAQLLALYQRQHEAERLPPGASRKRVCRMLQRALLAWATGELDCNGSGIERWADFQERVRATLAAMSASGRRKVLP